MPENNENSTNNLSEFGNFTARTFTVQSSNGPIVISDTDIPIDNIGLYNSLTKAKEEDNNAIVTDYITNSKIKKGEAVKIYNRGYVKSDNPNIIQDYFLKGIFFLNDPLDVSRQSPVFLIYTDIDQNGKLINPIVTISNENFKYDSIRIFDYDEHLKCKKLHFTVSSYGALSTLLNNKIFNYYYKESLHDNIFHRKDTINARDLAKTPKTQYRKKNEDNSYVAPKKPNTYINTLGKKYTFGLEIETSAGRLPHRIDRIIDYTAVHDGSLRDDDGNVYGGEYVTGVLRGDQGLLQTRLLCNELTKRCMLNTKCGVHVHLGGIDFTKENIILMYYLYQNLQDEILSIFPPSRRDNQYCRKLSKVDIDINNIKADYYYFISHYYNEIIKLLSQRGHCDININKKKDHPKGHKCGYDHSAHRYCWVNFIPAVFNTRKNNIYTIEFRPHAASTSYKKIKNWLLICMALVDVVENHKSEIYANPNLRLNDIIRICYPKNYEKLINYVEKRRTKFSTEEDHDRNETLDNEIEDNLSIKNL